MTEDQQAASHPSQADPPSAATAAARALSRLADFARTTLQTEASLAKQSAELTWATLAGNLDRTSANKAYVESLTREGSRYWRAVGELGFDYATELVALGKSVSTTVLREVAEAARRPGTGHTSGFAADSSAPTAQHVKPEGGGPQSTYSWTSDGPSSEVHDHGGSGRRVEVSLLGSVGGRAEGTITVANQHPRPRRIQLSPSDLVDSAGAVVGASLEVSPSTITVPSGQERSVSLGIALDAASFSAGSHYSCTVDVTGGDEATSEVSIEVRA
jgi:hypothetical protein